MAPAPSIGAAGGSYTFTIDTPGTFGSWYCHKHGEEIRKGRIEVVP